MPKKFLLDPETVDAIKLLQKRWTTSQGRVIDRAIREAICVEKCRKPPRP